MGQPDSHSTSQCNASNQARSSNTSEFAPEDAEPPPSTSSTSNAEVDHGTTTLTEKSVCIRDSLRERPPPLDTQQDSTKAPDLVANAHPCRADRKRHKLRSKLRHLFITKNSVAPPPTYKESAIRTLCYTPLNICLLCVPVSWALHYTGQPATLVFVFAALGILPLAALLGFGTEQVALRTSQSVGGLLNASLGNVVELIVAGLALAKCDLDLVQSSLLGGLISNLLLVLGMAFVAGGYRFKQQEFHPIVAQLNLSLMTLSVITLLVPAAFHELLGNRYSEGEEGPILLQLSRGTSIILLLIYMAYLFFQFYSHSYLFVDTIQKPSLRQTSSSVSTRRPDIEAATPVDSPSTSHLEVPRLNIPFALCLLAGTTGLAYLTAEFLVDALDEVAESAPFSKEFLTLIIIPIISNAAEHTTAVVVASKGKFDLALGVAVGSSIQIALFVIPVLVLAAWGADKPLTLVFDPMETICLFFSVLLVKFAVEDGKAHWMSGVVLVAVYVVIALSFWDFPDGTRDDLGLVCS